MKFSPLLLLPSILASNLVIHKSFTPEILVQGREANVTITLYNTGDSVLRNIAVSDATADNSTAFKLISKHASARYLILQPGKNVSHTFTVLPRVSGLVRDEVATVFFELANSKHTAKSGSMGALKVYSVKEFNAEYADHQAEWSLFLVCAAIVVLVPWYLYYSSDARVADGKLKSN